MNGIDTNALVRLFTGDNPDQRRVAQNKIDDAAARGDTIYVNMLVLAELFWVLRSAYGMSRLECVGCIRALTETAGVGIEQELLVGEALNRAERGFDFADALIGLINQHAGCVTTGTFDRRATGMPEFELLSAAPA